MDLKTKFGPSVFVCVRSSLGGQHLVDGRVVSGFTQALLVRVDARERRRLIEVDGRVASGAFRGVDRCRRRHQRVARRHGRRLGTLPAALQLQFNVVHPLHLSNRKFSTLTQILSSEELKFLSVTVLSGETNKEHKVSELLKF